MKKINLTLIIVFFLLTIGFSCAESIKEYSDPSVTINARVQEKFIISLQSNPSTGYSWQLASPVDEKIVKLIDSQYVAKKTKMVGAGGKELWTFETQAMGKAEISLEYVRPWEKDVPAARQEVFTVLVD